MCIRHTYASPSATTSAISGSPRSAVTSLTSSAPSASARRATSALDVSTDRGMPASPSSTAHALELLRRSDRSAPGRSLPPRRRAGASAAAPTVPPPSRGRQEPSAEKLAGGRWDTHDRRAWPTLLDDGLVRRGPTPSDTSVKSRFMRQYANTGPRVSARARFSILLRSSHSELPLYCVFRPSRRFNNHAAGVGCVLGLVTTASSDRHLVPRPSEVGNDRRTARPAFIGDGPVICCCRSWARSLFIRCRESSTGM